MKSHIVIRTTLSRTMIFCDDFPFKPSLLFSAKSHARFSCSIVKTLTTAHCRYNFFAGSSPTENLSLASFSSPVDMDKTRKSGLNACFFGFVLFLHFVFWSLFGRYCREKIRKVTHK